MIQSFQCPICGNLNAIGEPSCTVCGQNFVYYCPVCASPLNNRYTNCPSCQTLFNWSRGPLQRYQAMESNTGSSQNAPSDVPVSRPAQSFRQNPSVVLPEKSPGSVPDQSRSNARVIETAATPGVTSRPAFWVTLMIGCMVVIAVLLLIDRIINA
jgi:hypothetical protein